MNKLYYDAYVSIFKWLDFQSLVHLLNCSNKNIYYQVRKYIKEKEIYEYIIRYDLFRLIHYKSLIDNSNTVIFIQNIFHKGCNLEVFKHLLIPGIRINDMS